MSERIEILPENVANQIAAGEVVQRPASIVKELTENAVDAGASAVHVIVRDGGKSLIQVIDDGIGMASGDAVRAFARHATSKIRKSKDLFALHTFGFRGEALASIASVAEVEMRTRREEDEVGVLVAIAGGTENDAKSESVSCPKGTSITVRNLFFNTPARRKFLKSDATETKQIMAEFQRVALCNPDKAFTLTADDKMLLNLAPGNLHQRIVALAGKRIGNQLLDVGVDTPIVRISGYIGLPATAKKGSGEQFFFVNGRYFRSAYLQKAVINGYNKLLPFGYTPSYFIYIEVEPSRVDVNIHPQKTEVKFEDEQAMWQIIASAVARSLGKHNVVPMLDFDNKATGLEIPVYTGRPDSPDFAGGGFSSESGGTSGRSGSVQPVRMPRAAFKPEGEYNPFKTYDRGEWIDPATKGAAFDAEKIPFMEKIPPGLVEIEPDGEQPAFSFQTSGAEQSGEQYEEFASSATEDAVDQPLPEMGAGLSAAGKCLTLPGGRYVVTTTADGVVVIDRPKAMFRITYEELLEKLENGDPQSGIGQRELFPEQVELSASDHFLLMEHAEELTRMGFDLRDMGGQTVVVYGLPAEMAGEITPREAVEELLCQIKTEGGSLRDNHKERLAAALARSCHAQRGGSKTQPKGMTREEGESLVNRLFACEEPNYTPDGKPVMTVVSVMEIEKRLKKG